jgi:4-hydroxy-tetrahydrodipicolinate reductase
MARLRVVLAGATGRVGRVVAPAIRDAADMVLAGAVALDGVGRDLGEHLFQQPWGVAIAPDVASALDAAPADVLVDFTAGAVAGQDAIAAARRGVAPVVGATGIPPSELRALEQECEARRIGGVVIANFSLGAMLLSRFAREAAATFPHCEIIEMHHHQKLDAPSGTARRLAERLGVIAGREVPVHSVRLPGLLAHHRALFGGAGETLTISHDTVGRDCYVPGVLLAVRRVRELRRVVYDLEDLLPA